MSLRDLERASIRSFVESHADKLTGRVLDYGCGKQPYRKIVLEAGGEYFGLDDPTWPGSVVEEPVRVDLMRQPPSYDAVLCTQVIQYVPDTLSWLHEIYESIREEGWLVMTGPTNWPTVEPEDLHRFTAAGAWALLEGAGFREANMWERAHVEFEGERWSLGWGAVARA